MKLFLTMEKLLFGGVVNSVSCSLPSDLTSELPVHIFSVRLILQLIVWDIRIFGVSIMFPLLIRCKICFPRWPENILLIRTEILVCELSELLCTINALIHCKFMPKTKHYITCQDQNL